jgi:hypothetical protein
MKNILLPVDENEQMPSALATARLAANLFGGTVEGVALRPAFAAIVASDGTLKPGDGFQIPPATPHAGGKPGTAKSRILITYIVEKGKPLASPA